MSNTTAPNLGVIITNPFVRRLIYGAYIIALVVVGAIQVGYAAVTAANPDWLIVSVAVLAYLGIPVAGLAAANTSPAVQPTQ